MLAGVSFCGPSLLLLCLCLQTTLHVSDGKRNISNTTTDGKPNFTNTTDQYPSTPPEGWRVISSVTLLEYLDALEQNLLRLLDSGALRIPKWPKGPHADMLDFLSAISEDRRRSFKPYPHHPVAQFHLIRRFVHDWPAWMDRVDEWAGNSSSSRTAQAFYRDARRSGPAQLSIKELINCGRLLVDVTSRRGVNRTDWDNGKVLGVQSAPMSDVELLELAAISITNEKEKGRNVRMANAAYWLAIIKDRRGRCKELLLDHSIIDTLAIRKLFEQVGGRRKVTSSLMEVCGDVDFLSQLHRFNGQRRMEEKVEESACAVSGNLYQTVNLSRPLACFWKSFFKSSYFRFRAEELTNSPITVLFIHNLLSSNLRRQIIDLSEQGMRPATVLSPTNSRMFYKEGRNAYHSSVSSYSTPAKKLNRLLDHLEGFKEPPVMRAGMVGVNYGFAGKYDSHFDIIVTSKFPHRRLATVVVYLTDVLQGGGTFFPHFHAKASPSAGSAVMWYNFVDGKPQETTLHMGCPVDVGNKWIVNRWIAEAHHEHLLVSKARPVRSLT